MHGGGSIVKRRLSIGCVLIASSAFPNCGGKTDEDDRSFAPGTGGSVNSAGGSAGGAIWVGTGGRPVTPEGPPGTGGSAAPAPIGTSPVPMPPVAGGAPGTGPVGTGGRFDPGPGGAPPGAGASYGASSGDGGAGITIGTGGALGEGDAGGAAGEGGAAGSAAPSFIGIPAR
jgi:hypothetical protein